MSLGKLRTRLLLSLVLALVVIVALMAYGDFAHIIRAASQFQWSLIPLILALTLVNYLLRFGKWHFYLHLIGAGEVGKGESFMIFFSGLSMVVTPGKVGEWLKSYLLQTARGIPFGRSAPIVVAERLTDGVAMLLLASGGILLTQLGWQVLVVVLLLAGLVVAGSQSRSLTGFVLSVGERLPLVSRRIHHLREFFDSALTLFRPRNLLLAIAVGFVSWGAESVAFYLILVGMGLEPSLLLLVQAAFILSVSTLVGSLFMVPGGLGLAEGGITGLSQLLLGMSAEAAVTSALLIRLSTLWFGVALGTIALMLFTRRLAGPGKLPSLPDMAEQGEIQAH
jgi:uncharacterized protein (TIRG00374 family)